MYVSIEQLIQDPQNIVIDLREHELFQQQHFNETINIPLSIFNSQISFLPFDKSIYLICETGKNAKKLSKKLQNESYQCFAIPYGFTLLKEYAKSSSQNIE